MKKLSRKIPKQHVRRCRWCGYKTHRKYWQSDKCPLCGRAAGYVESTHGALSEEEMKEIKEKMRLEQEKTRSLSSAQRGC